MGAELTAFCGSLVLSYTDEFRFFMTLESIAR